MNWFKRVLIAQATLAPANQESVDQWKKQTEDRVKLLQQQAQTVQRQISETNQWISWLNNDSNANPANKPANDQKVQQYTQGLTDLNSRLTELNTEMDPKNQSSAVSDQQYVNEYHNNNTGRTGKPVGQYNPSYQQQNVWNKELWGNPFAARLNKLDQRIQKERARFN
jgi:chromosome segregation ATPase